MSRNTFTDQRGNNSRAVFDKGKRGDSLPRTSLSGEILGYSAPVPRGKPFRLPNDERPANRPLAADLPWQPAWQGNNMKTERAAVVATEEARLRPRRYIPKEPEPDGEK